MGKENYNIVLVPTNQESITNIIEDYAYLAKDCESVGGYRELLMTFYNEVVLKVEQDFLVELSQRHIERLQDIDEELDRYRS